jgi:hypothetical protein
MLGMAKRIRADVTPRIAASSETGPEKTKNGSPVSFSRMPISRQPIALPMVLAPKYFSNRAANLQGSNRALRN